MSKTVTNNERYTAPEMEEIVINTDSQILDSSPGGGGIEDDRNDDPE
ncbi:MAG: hypothetical protein IJ840_03855 [Bacteroidales bacterium]|nr:hypothetical protein [Bacteroidales bacterium]